MGPLRQNRRLTAGRILGFITMICAFCQAPLACSQGVSYAEYNVKLAFLFNFARFVEWPPDAFSGDNAPLVICVLGENPFKAELEDELRGRMAAGHPIEIKRFPPSADSGACHLMFIPSREGKAGEKMLPALKGSNTLTVGETQGFAERGGIVNFVLRDDRKLGFEINLGAASQTRLKISSKLLNLARIVK